MHIDDRGEDRVGDGNIEGRGERKVSLKIYLSSSIGF
jgi:hypothetical protein